MLGEIPSFTGLIGYNSSGNHLKLFESHLKAVDYSEGFKNSAVEATKTQQATCTPDETLHYLTG